MSLKFYPAKHNSLFIWIWQYLNSWELKTKIELKINPQEILMLRSIPSKDSLILVANHSDDLDPRVCMELSRLSSRRFTFMANSEAFDAWYGVARWCLQLIGAFSLERGVADQAARRYAINTIKQTNNVLVVFPEGEIFNANDLIQPFKTGAVHIGLEAIKELYEASAAKNVSIVPIAIKYHYQNDISSALKRRIAKMEEHLSLHMRSANMRDELYRIMNKLIPQFDAKTVDELMTQLQETRENIISKIEQKYFDFENTKNDLLERAQKMEVYLREQISQKKFLTKQTFKQLERDLLTIKKTIQMATWLPEYIEVNPTPERLAETVIKLERVVFGVSKPPLFGKRKAWIKILDPVNLNAALSEYQKEPRDTAKQIAQKLHTEIQEAVLQMSGKCLQE